MLTNIKNIWHALMKETAFPYIVVLCVFLPFVLVTFLKKPAEEQTKTIPETEVVKTFDSNGCLIEKYNKEGHDITVTLCKEKIK